MNTFIRTFVCATLISAAAWGVESSEKISDFSKIRISKLLPEDFKPRITASKTLKELPEYMSLIQDKIDYTSDYFLHYSYSSEGVNDTEWGCAWRAIQTQLSPHFKENPEDLPSFKEIYETYGSRSFLEAELLKHYKVLPDSSWLAPHEEWHMWGDPIIGQMIAQHLGIQNYLVTLNDFPPSLMPKISDQTIDFITLKQMLVTHFQEGGNPVFIDNGRYAMNILGVGGKGSSFFLLIGDPHLNFDRDENSLNGLYVVELDHEGKQLSLDYPAIHNHFDPDSYRTLEFTSQSKWNILLTKNSIFGRPTN